MSYFAEFRFNKTVKDDNISYVTSSDASQPGRWCSLNLYDCDLLIDVDINQILALISAAANHRPENTPLWLIDAESETNWRRGQLVDIKDETKLTPWFPLNLKSMA